MFYSVDGDYLSNLDDSPKKSEKQEKSKPILQSKTGKSNPKNTSKQNDESTKLNSFKMLTPATFFKFFDKKNTAIVNTLDNPYFVVRKPFRKDFLKLYYPGKEFMNSEYNDNLELLILYCANYTCAAAKKYADKLVKKYPGYKLG